MEIIALLIILTFIINLMLLVYTRQEQEWIFKILSKTQEHMWDDITQIGKTVKALDPESNRKETGKNIRAMGRKIDANEHVSAYFREKYLKKD
tara:strand:- start:443 stop:721 length:279 start_codon:yes stop_codon:yes gene_type:complete